VADLRTKPKPRHMEMWFLYPKEGIAISIYGLPFAAMWAVVNLACRARPHRCFARLDRVPLFLRIALLGSRNEGCIYNLPPPWRGSHLCAAGGQTSRTTL